MPSAIKSDIVFVTLLYQQSALINEGRKMDAEIIKSNRRTIELKICTDGHLQVRAPHYMTDAAIADFLNKKSEWIARHQTRIKERQQKKAQEPPVQQLSPQDIRALADQAMKVIPDRVRFYAEKIGVDYGRVTIRNQKTRWGRCSAKGNLNFNCLLMLTPEDVQDYVVIHELCHRKEMNHSPKFWSEVAKIMPDYRNSKIWLKENGEDIIRRMLG